MIKILIAIAGTFLPERALNTSFRASARVFPTEDPSKVSGALLNLFPDARMTNSSDGVVAEFDNIDNLARLVTDQKTRYSFMDAMNEGCSEDHFVMTLNKQAATVSRVNVVDEPKPLGNIEFSGTVSDPVMYFEKILDVVGYLSARTQRREGREQSSSDNRS